MLTDKDEYIFFKPLQIKCNPNNFYTDYDKQAHYEDLKQNNENIKTLWKKFKTNWLISTWSQRKSKRLNIDYYRYIIPNLNDLYDIKHKIGKYPNIRKSMKQYIIIIWNVWIWQNDTRI